jgi:predicted NAD-dependent protein-ADP-ribosyltransferase YbiA (DUF1768 family)
VVEDPIFVDTAGRAAEEAAREFPPIPEDGRVLFYSRDRAEFGFLSHFCASPIVIGGVDRPTVEHFYQSQKSLEPRYYKAIHACQTPNAAESKSQTIPRALMADMWTRPRANLRKP